MDSVHTNAGQDVGTYPRHSPSAMRHHIHRASCGHVMRPVGTLLILSGHILGLVVLIQLLAPFLPSSASSPPKAREAAAPESRPVWGQEFESSVSDEVTYLGRGFAGPGPNLRLATVPDDPPVSAPGESIRQTIRPATLSAVTLPTGLSIPELNLHAPVLSVPLGEGTWEMRNVGAEVAYLEGTGSIGSGNLVLAGHIIQWGGADGPFRRLFKLEPGARIILLNGTETREYQVLYQRIVEPTDVEVVQPTDQHILTLITCTNWDPEAQRHLQRRIVVAEPIPSHRLMQDRLFEELE